MQDTTLIGIFIIGLTTGGLTCLAVQGGLLAATIAQREEEKLKEKAKKIGNALPILAFLAAKLVAYTVLGLLLGWFGSLFNLSLTVKLLVEFAVVIFMLAVALNLLNIHPIFRYFVIQPPKFLMRLVRNQSKSRDIFAPAVLGAFTVFIPCGTTQTMMLLAIAGGSPLLGAAILFAFVLGTSPVFFLLGLLATKLGEIWHKRFLRVAAYAIILLALFNLNNAIALTGSQWTFGKVTKLAFCTLAFCEGKSLEPGSQDPVLEATITIQNSGYSPKELTVKAGSEVKLTLVNKDGYTCAQAFTIPKLKIQKVVAPNQTETVVFTAPKQKGPLAFMCSMGMYRGVINVN